VPRITITIPTKLHDKIKAYATDNEISVSSAITKMAEIGLLVTENQNENPNLEDKFTEIERHCFKLMIQMNALLKNMASKELGYGQEEFKKLMDLSINKYQQLMGISPEEL
jgi:hypothetical protein